MEAYKIGGLGDNEEDAKRIKKAKREVVLKIEHVRWLSDNQHVVKILEIGSKKPQLQEEALVVFSIAAQSLKDRITMDSTLRESESRCAFHYINLYKN